MWSRLLLAAVIASPVGHASANYLVNGDFELFTGTFGSDGVARVLANQTTITGWTPVGETAIGRVPNAYNTTPASGNQGIDLTSYASFGGGVGLGIRQTMVDLVPGATYTVSFALGISNLPCVSGGINCTGPISVNVLAGSVTQTFMHSSAQPGNAWDYYSLDFVADGVEAPLQFTLASVVGYYAGLDDVRVSLVPEPRTWATLAFGLVAISATAARRRRKGVGSATST
jgi:hypothetical protein